MLNSAERQEMVAPRRDRQAFGGAAIALAVLFMGNNLPSALYGVLRAAFGYSSLTQTLLYAAAVAVILPGLAIFGPLSDGALALMIATSALAQFGAHRLHAVSAQLGGLGALAVGQRCWWPQRSSAIRFSRCWLWSAPAWAMASFSSAI